MELKFRAWHEENSEMVYFDADKMSCDTYIAGHFINLMGRGLLEQFTGLTDKNGKDIYERCEIDNKYVVTDNGVDYILFDISNGDTIRLSDYFMENNREIEITREYVPLQEDEERAHNKSIS